MQKHATQTATLCEAGRLIPENKPRALFRTAVATDSYSFAVLSSAPANLVAYQTTRLLQKKCASTLNKNQSCKHFFFAKGVVLKFDGRKAVVELTIPANKPISEVKGQADPSILRDDIVKDAGTMARILARDQPSKFNSKQWFLGLNCLQRHTRGRRAPSTFF